MTLTATIKSAKALKTKAEQAEQQSKVMDEKSAQFKQKADEHYIALGKKLAELKALKPKGTTWPAFVDKHFGMSRERADELIRIGTGVISLDDNRAIIAERTAKSKAKKKSGDTKGGITESDNVIRPAFKKKKKPKLEKGDCDYNPGDPDHVAEKGDTPEQVRRNVFLGVVDYYITEPTKALDEAFFSDASPEEATDDLFVAVAKAIAAWNAIADKLKLLQGATNGKKVKA